MCLPASVAKQTLHVAIKLFFCVVSLRVCSSPPMDVSPQLHRAYMHLTRGRKNK